MIPVVVRIVPIAVGALIVVVLWLMPRLTRPDLYFAVTVPPGFRDGSEGTSILRRYRRELSGVSVLALTLLAACGLTPAFRWAPLALMLQFGGCFVAFYRARGRVMPHAIPPTTIREAEVAFSNRRIPGGWAVASGPFVVLAACAGYLWSHWRRIPVRLVVHWGLQGQPDRWAARSFGSVFAPLLSTAMILAVLTIILYGMAHWLRPINAGGPQGARESRFRRTATAMLVAVEYFLALQSSWIAVQPLLPASIQGPPRGIVVLLPLLAAVAMVVVLVRLGQGGSRMSGPHSSQSDPAVPVGDRTEDRFWKLGVFYFNRDDPAVLVEKRFGLGYTVNMAHPVAWAVLLLLVLTPVLVVYLSRG